MSNYTQITFFAPKDALLSGNPSKIIYGAQVDPELSAISVAIATKYDSSSIGSGQVPFGAGSSSAPSITFASNLGTGLYLAAANSLGFTANGVAAGSISSAGAWSLPAGASVDTLTLAGASGGHYGLVVNAAANSHGVNILAGTTSSDNSFAVRSQNNATAYLYVQGDGQTFVQAPPAASAGPAGMAQVGYMEAPYNNQGGANYTLVMGDRGKAIGVTGPTHTLTIPANASVAFPVGTTIMVVNSTASGTISIAITTDTLLWLPSGSSGTRTLATLSVATLYKNTATQWLIWGFGIS
jgi:hypothetical protein